MPFLTLKEQAKLQLLESVLKEDIDSMPYQNWIPQNLHVLTKSGTLEPLTFNPIQESLNGIYDKHKAERGRVQLIIGKARQMGCSTWVQARAYERIARNANQNALVLAHDKEGSDWLFGMARRYKQTHQNAPPTDYSSKKEVVFSDPLNSSISVQVAHEYAGSSRTVQMLHISELSKWKNPEVTMLSLLQAAGSADIIIESTANGTEGQGKYYHDMWQDARAGRSEYEAVFFAWFDNPQYSVTEGTPSYNAVMQAPVSREDEQEELLMMERYGLTLEQIAWRRWAIRNLCNNNIDSFRQEYPANDEEMFLKVEGLRVFDIGACRMAKLQCKEPIATGRLMWDVPPELDSTGKCINRNELVVGFQEDPQGPLRLWAEPDPKARKYQFMGAADVAEGKEGGDFSSSKILDRNNRQIIAAWHERCDATLWGEYLAMQAIFFRAIIAPEINSAGAATLNRFNALTPYYVWTAQKLAPQSPYTKHDIGHYGWRTTGVNHEFMVQKLIDVIREGLWFDPDEPFWDQATSIVRKATGQAAISGKDRVACASILAAIDYLAPPPTPEPVEPEETEPTDYRSKRLQLSEPKPTPAPIKVSSKGLLAGLRRSK